MSAADSRPGAGSALPSGRRPSLHAPLRALGITDPNRAATLLEDPGLAAMMEDLGGIDILWAAADPDDALLTLSRLAETEAGAGAVRELLAGEDRRLSARRLISVIGTSRALADHLIAHPQAIAHLSAAAPGLIYGREALGERLRAAVVDTNNDTEAAIALRLAYRGRLLEIAAADLSAPDPLTQLELTTIALADLAAATIEVAWRTVCRDWADGASAVAIIALGKTGGRELNYVSDVDVIYVCTEQCDTEVAISHLQRMRQLICAPGPVPALWPIDVALRPEGKDGPLIRSLSSHVRYYQRWAKTWEFQALLKARPIAGGEELGRAYREQIASLAWSAAHREGFVSEIRAMRTRVEEHIPPAHAERQLKLGRGGLRDIEFTAQLLQMVHGRTDPALRVGDTLTALKRLAAGGYISRDAAKTLSAHYRFLRLVEHRVQLRALRRNHLLPTSEAGLRLLGRSLGQMRLTPNELNEKIRAIRTQVRALQQEIFYRPLLPATAALTDEEVQLTPAAAHDRLAAIGYRDPRGAMRHIAALTAGSSRRALIQQRLAPALLGWFADGPNPDGALAAFRVLSEEIGGTHWYLKLLRDSRAAAERLAGALSSSRFIAEQLPKMPEAVMWLDDDAQLAARSKADLRAEASARLARAGDDLHAKATALRALRRREMLRTALADAVGHIPEIDHAQALTRSADVVLEFLLAEVLAANPAPHPSIETAIIAVGRLGGKEMSYSSDADVLFVYRAGPAGESAAAPWAQEVARTVIRLAEAVSPEPALKIDCDLRPEGRNGPISRSLEAYKEYFAKWVEPWERQALLRARPAAGSRQLAALFLSEIDPIRFPASGLTTAERTSIRRLKARVENERIARGVERTRHLKLGPGALADVEWCAQLIQLDHAGTHRSLRVAATCEVLDRATRLGFLSDDDAHALRAGWILASRVRAANALMTGRTSGQKGDLFPHEPWEIRTITHLLGFTGSSQEFVETFSQVMRKARAATMRVFYGHTG